jgi:peptidoglycan/xylan/chitin deacetylase (PgdA/CDA1 family)
MGSGAIFMIQRVRPHEESLAPDGTIAETDPRLLEEMVSLIAAQKLKAVSLDEMRRRLVEQDLDSRFVCFTFDGAYRSVRDFVYPLFLKRGIPFAIYSATDYLDGSALPWWLALEVLVKESDKVSVAIGDDAEELRCRSFAEKQLAYSRLYRRLSGLDHQSRNAIIEASLRKQGIHAEMAARREMLSLQELADLAESELVTIGVHTDSHQPLSGLSYDQACDAVGKSLGILENATGKRPRHLAFPAGPSAAVTARDVKIAGDLEFATAVTNIEGALWPEHARELMALPRIALDNDPATLVRALMLSGASVPADGLKLHRAAG